MKKNLGISLSIAIIAGIWFFVSIMTGLEAWPAFIGWSAFFWEGANFKGVKRVFPAVVYGAVLGYITLEGIKLGLGGSPLMVAIIAALMVTVLAFVMTIAKAFPILSVASATFVGGSSYFALTGYLDKVPAFLQAIFVTSLGLIFGLLSMAFADFINKKILKLSEEDLA